MNDITTATFAYDLAQHEPVLIVDPDVGTVEDQDPALKEMILKNAGNRATGMAMDTTCAEVVFANLDSTNDRTYTFPVTRLGVPQVDIEGLAPRQYVEYRFLSTLLKEASGYSTTTYDRLISVCTDAGVDESVLDAAAASVPDPA